MISVAPKAQITPSTPSATSKFGMTNTNNISAKPITKIVMSKEWILPPRPKPGRKPCEDIPSSKRKAQNRAAQRAFRERRANRVGELEEKIMDMERDRAINEGILNNMIKSLKRENALLKAENENLKKMNKSLVKGQSPDGDAAAGGLESLESLFSLKPIAAVPLKRKSSTSIPREGETKEIDFTDAFAVQKPRKMPRLNDSYIFSKKPKSAVHLSSSSSSLSSAPSTPINTSLPSSILLSREPTGTASPIINNTGSVPFESCGFCSDDTPCVCREIENEHKQQKEETALEKEAKLKAEIEKKEKELILELTRSAQKEDLSQLVKCNGDPGTCLQCRADPLSTLFCKTVAEKSNPVVKLPVISTPSLSSTSVAELKKCRLPSLESLKLSEPGKQFVPCADAYKTISNHLDIRNIGINKITNNLQTKGMFVEVGSVVSCLRELDRNFSNSK